MLVTLRGPEVRDRAIARAAIADYQADFERCDRTARELREDGWPAEVVKPFQQAAEIAWFAARAERREVPS